MEARQSYGQSTTSGVALHAVKTVFWTGFSQATPGITPGMSQPNYLLLESVKWRLGPAVAITIGRSVVTNKKQTQV